MSIKLSIVIMAHPERKQWAEDLGKKLGAKVVYDRISNVWDTCRRSWLAIDPEAEYGLVLQDDAIICKDFLERAEALLQGDYLYSLFAGYLLTSRIRRAEQRGEDFVESWSVFNEIALCMRTEHIRSMIKHCDDRDVDTDQEIGRWARLKRLKVRYPLPSLVDHRDSESIYKRVYKKPPSRNPRKAVKYADQT